jgi:perosamine synthetase
LRRLREHGMNVSAADRHKAGKAIVEQYLEVGFNYRMTDLQAAIGIVQLGRLPDLITGRRAMAARYQALLRGVPGVRAATDPAYGTTNYQSFWVLLGDDVAADRNDVLSALADAGVSARRGIMAAHTEPAYADTPHGPLPVTELLTNRSLILPLHHELTPAQQDLVVDTLSTAIRATVPAAL